MLRAKHVQHRKDEHGFRDKLLSNTRGLGSIAGIPVVAEIVNAVNASKLGRKLLESALGVDATAPLPKFHSTTGSKRARQAAGKATEVKATGETRGKVALFVTCFLVIISMYGGGFSTVPAYLRDMFGTRYVGAIHGLLLTAWSAAGIFGPVLVNYIREYNVTHGVPKAQAYNTTMYIMAGLLVIGFICNFLIKAVHDRYHMKVNDPRAHDALNTAPAAARASGRKNHGCKSR
jgi:MFS family permease